LGQIDRALDYSTTLTLTVVVGAWITRRSAYRRVASSLIVALAWAFTPARPGPAGIRLFSRPMLAMLIFVGIILAGMYFILPVFNIKVPLP
jgi:hypothetical protein